MERDAMMVFAMHDTFFWSHKSSSNVQDRDCRDNDKMLCNRCLLKHEVQKRGRGEMLYENTFELNTAVGKPTIRNTIDISNT